MKKPHELLVVHIIAALTFVTSFVRADEAAAKDWTVVSMKDDWKTIFLA